MPADLPKRSTIWTPLTYSILLVLGILIGFQLNKYMARKRPIIKVIERNDRLEEIIDLIGAKYVDSVSADSLYEDAISGILKHLDPHTIYIPARDLAGVTEDMAGSFKGIGVEFSILDDTLMVTSVMTQGPSYDAGVKAGDRIIKINDSLVAGVGIESETIIGRLRGMEGTKVKLDLLRPEGPKHLEAWVERGTIPLHSIDAAYLLAPEVGYIRINRFSATTYREFMNALKKLQGKGMKKLVLDLRQNPGGYLDAATAIGDELLGGDRLLVYTEGRASQKEEYRSGSKGKFEKGPLVVLIDEGSASASEILAGAIQDWDRGLLIGRRSYGKGLVQEQFELGDGAALRLTVARYYTPTGRSIQRPYDKGKEQYAHDFRHRAETPAIEGGATGDTTRYYTEELHRVVYGGGGIWPDIDVPYETHEHARELSELMRAPQFNNSIYLYFSRNSAALGGYKNFSEFDQGFRDLAPLMQGLRKDLAPALPEETRKVWGDARALDYVRHRAKATIARMLFRNNGYFQEANKTDPIVQKALRVLQSREYSALIGR